MTAPYKIAIVGAASLSGKELADVLGDSTFSGADFLLMDDEEALGQVEAVADEVTFIQRIEPGSFEHIDFTFFASQQAVTRKHWRTALDAGSSILDLSCALEGESKVLVRAPWIREELKEPAAKEAPDLRTPAIVPAHPAAITLALLLLRLKKVAAVRNASATILEPASEYGRAAMDELHQQTVTLLSFQTLPREVYDTQVAFNCVPALGEAAKVSLSSTEERIRRHYALLSGGRLPQVALQLVHAPAFHGLTFSLAIELEKPSSVEEIEAALSGDHVDVVPGDADAPSNLTAAGQEDIMVRLRAEEDSRTRFWIWAAVDNLKFSALNAVACAQELRRLRPHGQIQ